MCYIESPGVDPRFNLALEQYVFDRMPRDREYLMLWRNDRAVIVGRNQDTLSEINAAYVRENGIRVVRRLSGGGAVYHDLGNLNFTFIADGNMADRLQMERFCGPIMDVLRRVGVEAEVNGRNDLTVGGRKISGNAQYSRDGRIMHHGTVLYDTNLEEMEKALCVPKEKLASKGVSSVRSRVMNLRPEIDGQPSMEWFMGYVRESMVRELAAGRYVLTDDDLSVVREIQAGRYDRDEWNFTISGSSDMY